MPFCWIKGCFLTDLDYFMLNYNKKFFIDYIAPIRNHCVMKKVCQRFTYDYANGTASSVIFICVDVI